ncbi:MAG: RNA 2'-phosphotransferase, partial [Gemmatimonadetes bacterium]|nr:RNA 2'-phosphotransferase [Gemmatimonadota bacterium]
MPDRRRISKLLSLILRHRPDEFGLTMDEYGYIPLGEVVEAVQQRYSAVAEEDIRTLVEDSRQRRFEI